MNLELLNVASSLTGDNTYYNMAKSHADRTMINHFRPDGSSYHVVSYDTITGKVLNQVTHQGVNNQSSWSRGQAWGLYGYTLCFEETNHSAYLERAQQIAKFIMENPAIPEDLIPYWDYNAPTIPDAPRDASAAAVTASALFELSTLVENGQTYFDYAEKIIKELSTPNYLAEKGTNNGFILKHSTGSLPHGSEIDVPLNYADYYYLEALKRYIKLKNIDSKALLSQK